MDFYEKQANDFLSQTDTTVQICFVGTRKNNLWQDKEPRNFYIVTIKNPKGKMSVKFWDSIYNTQNNKKPTVYNILSCLVTYDPGSFENFCQDYYYNTDNINALKIYRLAMQEYRDVARLFTPHERELLSEIQ